MESVRTAFNSADYFNFRSRFGLEPVIEAGGDQIDLLVHDRRERRTGRRSERGRFVWGVDKSVFDSNRPIRRERPFGTAPNRPSGLPIARRERHVFQRVEIAVVGVRPRRAAFPVDQQRPNRDTDLTGGCSEIIGAGRQSVHTVSGGVAAAQRAPGKAGLRAKHQYAELIIVAALQPTRHAGKCGLCGRAVAGGGAVGVISACRVPGTADISAQIKAGPGRRRGRKEWS